MKWNNGVSYPIQSGHGCIGCSEENFWDNGPFYERLPNMHGIGIESTADQVGKIALGAVGAGILIHAIGANIMKRKELKNRINRGKKTEALIKD
jgi:hydrogenase small subunit